MQAQSRLVDYREFPDLDPQRPYPRQAFIHLARRNLLLEMPILDIGAGPACNPVIREVVGNEVVIDGVDVDPRVLENNDLRERWHSPFESAPIPANSYQYAIAWNVLEHIEHPRQFLSKLAEILRPGGVFWGYTPNANHPFAMLSWTIEVVGGKGGFAKGNRSVNHYPSYYRLNSLKQVRRAAEGLPFTKGTFYHLYAPGWQTYFPRPFKWMPRAWDAATRQRSTAVLGFCLERGED